jgi:hypothetical protein
MPKFISISSEWLIGFVISAMAYTFLFYFNGWLTNTLVFGLGVNWIYLPAGLRLFLTLIFGLPGAIGIAAASFLISYYGDFPHDLTLCVGVGLISGFAPYLARYFVFSNLRLESDLSNPNFPKLIACILIYSLLSAGLHQWWFATMTLENTGSVNHFLVMFIGDVLGSLLLISLIKCCLDLIRRSRKTAY